MTIDRFAFDVELILLAAGAVTGGGSGVEWRNDHFACAARRHAMLADVVRLRWRAASPAPRAERTREPR
jgi:hypothetical protein